MLKRLLLPCLLFVCAGCSQQQNSTQVFEGETIELEIVEQEPQGLTATALWEDGWLD